MKHHGLLTALLVFLSAAGALAQSAESLHVALNREAERLKQSEGDKRLIEFVTAQNARKVPLAEIEKIDKSWTAGGQAQLIHQLTTNACAEYLRKLFVDRTHYTEVFLMDDQGALVCTLEKTSDYWQGDEDKWIKSFNHGHGTVFIDRPRFDESSKATIAQISVPIIDEGKTIGVLMVGVNAEKLMMHAAK